MFAALFRYRVSHNLLVNSHDLLMGSHQFLVGSHRCLLGSFGLIPVEEKENRKQISKVLRPSDLCERLKSNVS